MSILTSDKSLKMGKSTLAAFSSQAKDTLSLAEEASLIKEGKLSCRENLEAYYDRIIDVNDDMNAYITVANKDDLLQRADQLDQLLKDGVYLGPLHGTIIAVKDNIETAQLKTTGGTVALENNIPLSDSTVVTKLRDAGAVIIGKANLHELAFGITSHNPHYGPVRNPYNPNLIAGGSSGGSAAAVAQNLCSAAIGTDTGGSVRIPGALCGTVGLKTTKGRVGRGGVISLSTWCDTIGPITKTCQDAGLVLQAIVGPDERDPEATSDHTDGDYQPVARNSWDGVKLGVPRKYFYEDIDPAVAGVMKKVLKTMEEAGAELVDVDVNGLEGVVPNGFAIVLSETVHLLGEYLRQLDPPLTISEILDQLGPDVKETLGSQVGPDAEAIPAHVYLDAVHQFGPALKAGFAAALDGVDALVTPTVPLPAAPIGQDANVELNGEMKPTFLTYVRNTFPVSLAGLPALSVPAGYNEEGLPIGMQFIGKAWEEGKLLQLGHNWMEQ